MAQIYDNRRRPDSVPQQLRAVAATLRLRRRIRLLIRAVWLALLVWSAGLLALLLGLAVDLRLLAGASVLTLLIAAGYAWLSHPSLARLAQGLDRHYKLSQQLTTALEVAHEHETTPLDERLLSETTALLARMRRYFAARSRVPWREAETLAAVALLAIGMTVATHPLLPEAATPVALPELPPPSTPPAAQASAEPTEQPVADEQPPEQLSPEAQAAADAIADALRDNGATRSAAEALDQGDTAGAASDLRELADQADQLSEAARDDLAKGLRDAADQVGEQQPGLAEELRRQADALEEGGQEAAEALEDLARTVEQLGEQGQQAAEAPQASGAPGQQGQQGQQGDQPGGEQGQQPGAGSGAGNGDGLNGEQRGAQDGAQAQGDTLPLPQASASGGPTTNATGPRGPQIELGAGGTGQTQSSGGSQANQPLGGAADPLAIPPEYRDVVEDYFSPQP